MLRIALLLFFSFTIFLGIHSSQAVSATPPRVAHFTCDLDLPLAANDASTNIVFGTTQSVDDIKAKKPKGKTYLANLIGRGVAECQNETGFHFELPAQMAITLSSSKEIPLTSLRAQLSPLSVDGDVNKIFDIYSPHVILGNRPTTQPNADSVTSVIVKGDKDDVLLQINLNLPPELRSKVKVSKVDLKYDSEAPELH